MMLVINFIRLCCNTVNTEILKRNELNKFHKFNFIYLSLRKISRIRNVFPLGIQGGSVPKKIFSKSRFS